MATISKIRFTNVVYESGDKLYKDEVFHFDGHNGAIVLENGGGKTVFIQTAIQAIIPHVQVANRKMKDTLSFDTGPAHIAIEWIINEKPRQYGLTSVSLYKVKEQLHSLKYVYEYSSEEAHSIEHLPFVHGNSPAGKGEIQAYYSEMASNYMHAHTFDTNERYTAYLEENFGIVTSEWKSIVKVNSSEGDVERFFDECKTTGQLVDRLLIPTIEDGMAGYEADKFAISFESRLTAFQEYKQFQDKLQEYERIQRELDTLTTQFERLAQRRDEYSNKQADAKAYTIIINEQYNKYVESWALIERALEQAEVEKAALHHYEKSLAIAVERKSLRELEKELHRLQESVTTAEVKYDNAVIEQNALTYAHYKEQHELAIARRNRLQQQLAQFKQANESIDLVEHFQHIKEQLANAFLIYNRELNEQIEALQVTERQVAQQMTREQEALNRVEHQLQNVQLQVNSEQTTVANIQHDLEVLEKGLYVDETYTTMEEQQSIWATEQMKLDVQITELKNSNQQFKREQQQARAQQRQVEQQLEQTNAALTIKKTENKTIECEQQDVLRKLQKASKFWRNISTVYERQESIDQSLQDEIAHYRRRFELVLADERTATRLYDDYYEQSSFFADRYALSQLMHWQNQFTYLKTGYQYIEQFQEETGAIDYPFWSVAVVTTTEEAPRLLEKLQQNEDELQFPIHVLTLDKANAILQGERSTSNHWIKPTHWTTAHNVEQFEQWKGTIQARAQSAIVERQDVSRVLEEHQALYKDFQQFIEMYPLATKQQIENEITELQRTVFQLNKQLEQIRLHIVHCEREIDNQYGLIENKTNEMQVVNRQIEKAQEYLSKERKQQQHEKNRLYYEEERKTLRSQQRIMRRALEDRQQDYQEVKEDIARVSRTVEREVWDHPLYNKVKNESPKRSSHSIQSLVEQYEEKELQVAGIVSEQQSVEREFQNTVEYVGQIEQNIETITVKYPLLKEDTYELLFYNKEQLERVTEQLGKLEHYLMEAKQLERTMQSKVDRQQGVVQEKLAGIEKPRLFERPLAVEEKELTAAWEQWNRTFNTLQQEKKQVDEQTKYWLHTKERLQEANYEHRFLREEIVATTLTEQEQVDFLYTCEQVVLTIKDTLKRYKRFYEEEQQRTDKERQLYITFCRTTITDSRLQQTSVQGIEARNSYEEVLQYKQLVEQRLQKAEQYAKQHIQTYDKELELFLSHMSAHIRALRTELGAIEKQTVIKVDDKMREVFRITLPDWEDSEAKKLLRAHITWILTQLQSERFHLVEGGLDYVKVRTSLEKWLNSRQLLQVAIQNEPIRVRCHKVTNDHNISRASYTWEESNNWSGGEKWSKNMTLFLGLLNYVSEKKQPNRPHMKRQRSVILDNPFGKASSGHVLTPVFFIAERLGFQIITLTAHAEGKFISDFFPVVYSCRLRKAVNGKTQIMTKEKTIHSAYVRDLTPESLERINPSEQLALFE